MPNKTEYKPCPFCGGQPVRKVERDILTVSCPNCVSVGFSNHVRFGCMSDSSWNRRANTSENDIYKAVDKICSERESDGSYKGNSHHLSQEIVMEVMKVITASRKDKE